MRALSYGLLLLQELTIVEKHISAMFLKFKANMGHMAIINESRAGYRTTVIQREAEVIRIHKH